MICTKYLVSETQIDYSKWNMCNAFGSHIYRDKMEFKNRYERRLSVELEIKDETKRRKAYHLSYGLWWHSLTRQPCMHTIDWRLCAPGCRRCGTSSLSAAFLNHESSLHESLMDF